MLILTKNEHSDSVFPCRLVDIAGSGKKEKKHKAKVIKSEIKTRALALWWELHASHIFMIQAEDLAKIKSARRHQHSFFPTQSKRTQFSSSSYFSPGHLHHNRSCSMHPPVGPESHYHRLCLGHKWMFRKQKEKNTHTHIEVDPVFAAVVLWGESNLLPLGGRICV